MAERGRSKVGVTTDAGKWIPHIPRLLRLISLAVVQKKLKQKKVYRKEEVERRY